ncbi:hypothetical protein L227DRAFT_571205 [Lentinus tigrinus ALCF2SS1-6]|uniref:Uncharacterized protein n=1 Tax=Lentinus tigrinus ALCF2SS1-6 TaxID=1328759 RepID=A0A5C2SLT2_9APHY|nr:hypothetical protein L227DRAFT_571205 [Lentinus tigrinus ALCF2SS1-6]
MVKSKEEIIAQFNEDVNMTVEELDAWLKDPKSEKAGTGVGIESGHKIIEILRKNPTKDPEKYDDEDLEHMHKVVGYLNRHLAQEDKLKETKTRTELENSKGTISLKNWGHDPVKAFDENGDTENMGRDSATEDKTTDKSDKEAESGATENDEGRTKAPEPAMGGMREAEVDEVSRERPLVEEDKNDKGGANGSGVGEDVKKRKLDDEPAAGQVDASGPGSDSTGAEGLDKANEVGGVDEEERPRKKSKVDGEDTV